LAWLSARPRATTAAALLAVWGGVSAWLAAGFTSRVRDWALQNDELLYEKLASSVARTHSPIPELHGQAVAVLNQLYPILLAPFFGAYDVPTAFHAAHVFNAPLMASATIPAYLLARRVVGRGPALAVALLSALVPWMVISGALLTEVAAYPAFLWAVLGLERAVAEPSPRSDAFAAAALVLAVLARTQFVFLVAVLPAAIVAHELACAGSEPGRARRTGRAIVGRHRVLAALYVAGGVVAGVVAALGSLGDLLGTYAVTAHGSPLPSAVWRAIATHLDTVALASGLVPFVLGGGWLAAALGRTRDRRSHAFATLAVLVIGSLTVEASSFDVRFGGPHDVHDRYLFYLVPLLLVGTAAALGEGRRRSTALAAGALTAWFAATAPLLDYSTPKGYLVDSPGRIFGDTLREQAGSLGTGTFVALASLCVGLAVAAGLLVVPRRLLAVAVLAFLLPFSVLTTRAEIDRALASTGPSGRPFAGPPGSVLDWIDRTLPDGSRVAMVPYPTSSDFAPTAVLWWDVEFWNDSVVRTYVAGDGHFSYAPFPNAELAPDWETGVVTGSESAPAYVVHAPNDARFQLSGPRHAENLGLRVIVADRPYRALWQTRGLDTDGWLLAARPATVRVYSREDAARLVDVEISLAAPEAAPARYRLTWPGGTRTGEAAANAVSGESVPLCVPAGSHADVTLTSLASTTVPAAPLGFDVTGTRRVSAHVTSVTLGGPGAACAP
jgi:hypothetical protein